LFAAVKADTELADLTCFIDSNGHLGASGWEKLLPVTDGVMLDIKAFGKSKHQQLTGKHNDRSLQSAKILQAAGKLYDLRYLLIPGKTDGDDELDQLTDFAHGLGTDVQIKLNAFQRHGVRGAALEWEKMPEEGVNVVAERLRAAGISKVVTPAVYV
jgi:pyruvate formate lyase activating enzyme